MHKLYIRLHQVGEISETVAAGCVVCVEEIVVIVVVYASQTEQEKKQNVCVGCKVGVVLRT